MKDDNLGQDEKDDKISQDGKDDNLGLDEKDDLLKDCAACSVIVIIDSQAV